MQEPVDKVIWIGDTAFLLGDSAESDSELRRLAKIVEKEGTHAQWSK